MSAPTGSVATFDVTNSGTTVLSTLLTIDANETTSVSAATQTVISGSTFNDDDVITVNIDGVGSTLPGTGGKITFYFTKT